MQSHNNSDVLKLILLIIKKLKKPQMDLNLTASKHESQKWVSVVFDAEANNENIFGQWFLISRYYLIFSV